MLSFVKSRQNIVDEFPGSFLVSTASLFLTLGAVVFFHFFVQGLSFFDIDIFADFFFFKTVFFPITVRSHLSLNFFAFLKDVTTLEFGISKSMSNTCLELLSVHDLDVLLNYSFQQTVSDYNLMSKIL